MMMNHSVHPFQRTLNRHLTPPAPSAKRNPQSPKDYSIEAGEKRERRVNGGEQECNRTLACLDQPDHWDVGLLDFLEDIPVVPD